MKITSCIAVAFTSLSILTATAAEEPQKDGPAEQAVAVLQPTKGQKVKGTITFTKEGDNIRVRGEVTGLTPGPHGFHVHQYGDLTSDDGTSAGGHFNPTGDPHGAHDAEERHVGDFGNIEADKSGTAKVDFVDERIAFEGLNSILGRGLVVHAKPDDLKSQPSGDAGARVAVAVIGAANPGKKE